MAVTMAMGYNNNYYIHGLIIMHAYRIIMINCYVHEIAAGNVNVLHAHVQCICTDPGMVILKF